MLSRCADVLVKKLIANGTVPKEKEAIYVFGILQGLRTMCEAILLLVTSFVLGLFWQCMIILLLFSAIRIYAGGYHAKTPCRCAFQSWILMIGVLLYLKYIPKYLLFEAIIIIITGIMILIFAPVQTKNKPLYKYEIKKYRKKAIILYISDVLIWGAGVLFSVTSISHCVEAALVMLLIVMVLGIFRK